MHSVLETILNGEHDKARSTMENAEAIPVYIAIMAAIWHQLRKKLPSRYERYINSAKWRRRSRICRRLAGGVCQTKGCHRPAHVAHHKRYKNLASWTLIELLDLVALCRNCHAGLHRVEGGRLRQARKSNPYIKRDVILKQTTEDWVSGVISRKEMAA